MKKIILEHKKCIILQVIVIVTLIIFFNNQMKVKVIESSEEMLEINANITIEEIDDYLTGHNSEFNYRKIVSAYYSTYMQLRELNNLTENDRKDKRSLEYLIDMNAVYGGLLSGSNISSDEFKKIKKAFLCIRDKDWENELVLSDLFQQIRTKIEEN